MIFEHGVIYDACTTTTSIDFTPGTDQKAPLIVLPEVKGAWELINSSAVAGMTGKVFFFWFWRKQQKGLD